METTGGIRPIFESERKLAEYADEYAKQQVSEALDRIEKAYYGNLNDWGWVITEIESINKELGGA